MFEKDLTDINKYVHAKSAKMGSFIRKLIPLVNFRGIPRLLYNTRSLTIGKKTKLFEIDGGIRLLLDPQDYFQCMIFYGLYSPDILEIFRRCIKPGDEVVDIGGNIGYFTVQLAQLVTSSGRVYSFEPDPRSYKQLLQSVEAKNMNWVQIFPIALSNNHGNIDFYLSPQLGWSTAVKNSHLQNCYPITVETTTLDSLLVHKRITNKIRLIKLDVEGFEEKVISGMLTVLERCRPILIMEVNNRMLSANGNDCSSLLSILKSLDFNVYAIKPYGRFPSNFNLVSVDRECDDCDAICIPIEKEQIIMKTLNRLKG